MLASLRLRCLLCRPAGAVRVAAVPSSHQTPPLEPPSKGPPRVKLRQWPAFMNTPLWRRGKWPVGSPPIAPLGTDCQRPEQPRHQPRATVARIACGQSARPDRVSDVPTWRATWPGRPKPAPCHHRQASDLVEGGSRCELPSCTRPAPRRLGVRRETRLVSRKMQVGGLLIPGVTASCRQRAIEGRHISRVPAERRPASICPPTPSKRFKRKRGHSATEHSARSWYWAIHETERHSCPAHQGTHECGRLGRRGSELWTTGGLRIALPHLPRKPA
jgi:hypothetical protein